MNKLQVFNNQEFGQVRVILINDKEYFCGKDVANALGYKRTVDAVRQHCKEKGTAKHRTLTNGGKQEMTYIDEGNIYRLVTNSQLPSAEKFEEWIFDEVLPSIRKHGAYMTPQKIEEVLLNPDTIIQLATNLKEERAKRIEVEKENKILAQETLTWESRKMINALIRAYGGKAGYDVAWRDYKKELLYKHSININSRATAYLNSGGVKSKLKKLDMIHDEEIENALSTAVAVCKNNKIDISGIIEKFSA